MKIVSTIFNPESLPEGFQLNRFAGNYYQDEISSDRIVVPVVYSGDFYMAVWDGGKWIEGASESEIVEINKKHTPKVVSQRQLRTQLVLNGFNLDSIQVAINELSEPNKSVAQIAWDYAITFERDSPLLMCLATNLGLTVDEVDTIFLNASKL